MAETVALTMGELDRLQVMCQLAERPLIRRRAAARAAPPPRLPAPPPPRLPRRTRPARWLGTCQVRGPGPVCTLLVYVDDATSELMALRFPEVESTFDYFRATRDYLEEHGKPM